MAASRVLGKRRTRRRAAGGRRASGGEDVSDATAQPTVQPGDDHVRFVEADPAQPVTTDAEEGASRSDRARRTAYHSRFVAVYVALALVVGIGAGALVISLLK